MIRLHSILSLVTCLVFSTAAFAQTQLTLTAKYPDGEVFSRTYTADELLALEQTVVVTENDYVETRTTFVGPRISTLLAEFELHDTVEISATALNDYRTSIPLEEVLKYDVIVAVLMNGEPMPIRDKGPFWIIYPMSDHSELQEPIYNDRLIWQLASLSLVYPS